MKLLLSLVLVTGSVFANVSLGNKYFRSAVSDCNGYLHPAEATDMEAAQVKSCVENKLKEINRYEDLKETVEFWRPLMTMKDNESRARCRKYIGTRGFHGEDSGEYEACINQEKCVNPTPWIDHVGLSDAPCVSPNSLGVNNHGKVVSGDRSAVADKKLEMQESKKAGNGAAKK